MRGLNLGLSLPLGGSVPPEDSGTQHGLTVNPFTISATGTAFNLADVANGKFWYRADSGRTMVSTKVSALSDRLGIQAAQGQPTDAKRPLVNVADAGYNGHDTLDLSGGQWMTLAALAASMSNPFTVYWVGQVATDHSTFRVAWGDPNSVSNANLVGTITSGNMYIGSATVLSSGVAGGAKQVICGVFNTGSTSAIYVNSLTAQATNATGTNPLAGLSIGIYSDLTSFPSLGKFAEIFGGAGAHDATTRGKVINYLANRYNITLV